MKLKKLYAFNTFMPIERPNYITMNLKQEEPSAVNSVNIHKFRVTVELVNEPKEVYRQRLIDLYKDTGSNMHHRRNILDAAKRMKIDIRDESGEYPCAD